MKNQRKESEQGVYFVSYLNCCFCCSGSWLKYLILNKKIMNTKMLTLFLLIFCTCQVCWRIPWKIISIQNLFWIKFCSRKKSTHSYWYFKSNQNIRKIPFSCKQQHEALRRRKYKANKQQILLLKLDTFFFVDISTHL